MVPSGWVLVLLLLGDWLGSCISRRGSRGAGRKVAAAELLAGGSSSGSVSSRPVQILLNRAAASIILGPACPLSTGACAADAADATGAAIAGGAGEGADGTCAVGAASDGLGDTCEVLCWSSLAAGADVIDELAAVP